MTILTATTAFLVAAGGLTAALSGGVQSVVDKVFTVDRTSSQVKAIDERVTILESNRKVAENDRSDLLRIVADLTDVARDLASLGVDTRKVVEARRQVELKIARLDAQIEMMREDERRRRKT